MVTKINIVVCILLSIFTCGIYGIFWFIVLNDDVRTVSNDDRFQGGKAFLLSLITCGIYTFYWSYIVGKAMMQAKAKNNLPPEDNSILYLILSIFGLGIVNYCLIQNDLNTISDKNSAA